MEDFSKSVQLWRHDFIAWAEVFFPDLKWREPQLIAARELSKIVSAKLKKYEKAPMTEEETVYAKKRGISIMSAQGVGKGHFVSVVIWWALAAFYLPHLVISSSTDKQLKNTLWSRIAELRDQSATFGGDKPFLELFFKQTAEKIFKPEFNGLQWFAEGVVAGNNAAKSGSVSAAGRHNKIQFFIFDEASDIPNSFFETIEGTSSDPVSVSIILFNPTANTGYAIDTQIAYRNQWVAMNWSGLGILDQDHIDMVREKHGEESNFYRIRILGLPPITDSNSLIPFEWVKRNIVKTANYPIGREKFSFDGFSTLPKRIGGLDVGGGGDPSGIYSHEGGNFIDLTMWSYADSDRVIGAVIDYIFRHELDLLFVDNIGIGQPVYWALKNNPLVKHKIFPCDVRRASSNPSFSSYRDQIWWKIRELFEHNKICIPNDDELISQLTSIKYEELRSGAIKVESKTKLAERGIKSPNKADMVVMSYSVNELVAGNNLVRSAPPGWKPLNFRQDSQPSLRWMVA